jgi:hypothetical protein
VQAQDQWYVADGVAQRAGRAKAKDAMARCRHASRDVAVGVYAKARGIGAKATPSLDPISRGTGTECEVALEGSTAGANFTKSLTATPTPTDSLEPPEQGRLMRLGWAKLLKRVFNLDLTQCPHCGGDLRIVAAILQRQAIEKILNHLGLDPQPPPRAPARGQMAF